MHNRFDQIAKRLAQGALGRFGFTAAEDELTAETQRADLRHEPDPASEGERGVLGLLGRLSAVPCLIEVYSQTPNAEAFRACLTKHLVAWQQRTRKDAHAASDSFLWIISAGRPTTLLQDLQLEPASQWPTGVYLFGGDVVRAGIVVASELPRDRSSLLIRLMAGGRLLTSAISDVAALPADAYERATAEPILLEFQHLFDRQPTADPEEQDYIMAMLKSWEDGKAEARAEGRAEGVAEGRAEALLTVLRVRGIAVGDAARARILAEGDRERLERLLEAALTARSVEDVLG